MKKHELLKYAYDNYPKGTIFWWPHDAVKNKVTSSGVFNIHNSKWIFDKNDRSKAVFNGDNWAEIIAEETRIPLLVSEDGVDLYEGNYYHRAYKSPSCANWNYNGFWKGLEADCYGIQKPEEFKIFSTKQAALKWIEEQNKPKTKTMALYFGHEAIINFDKSEVRIMDADKEVSTLSFGDINALSVEIK